MFLPTEFLLQERLQEREREVEKIQLVRLVTDGLTDQLQRYGARLFDTNKAEKQPKPSKN
jgi:hypothetical protein